MNSLIEMLADDAAKTPETLVKVLYDSLDETQRKRCCFAWDHTDAERECPAFC